MDKVYPKGILRGIARYKDTGNDSHKVKGGNNDKKTKIWVGLKVLRALHQRSSSWGASHHYEYYYLKVPEAKVVSVFSLI